MDMDKIPAKLAIRDRITSMAAHLFRNGAPLWDDEHSPPYEFRDLGYGKFEVEVGEHTFAVQVRTVRKLKE